MNELATVSGVKSENVIADQVRLFRETLRAAGPVTPWNLPKKAPIFWQGSGFRLCYVAGMTCEVFIPLNDIATEGYECGRPGEYDERLEMVVCEEHKKELVDFNAASPKRITAIRRRSEAA